MGAVERFDIIQSFRLAVHAELFQRELNQVAHSDWRVGGKRGLFAKDNGGVVFAPGGGLPSLRQEGIRAHNLIGPAVTRDETYPDGGLIQFIIQVVFQFLRQDAVGLLISEITPSVGSRDFAALSAPVQFRNPADVTARRRRDTFRKFRRHTGFRQIVGVYGDKAANLQRALVIGEARRERGDGAFRIRRVTRNLFRLHDCGENPAKIGLKRVSEASVQQTERGNILRVQGAHRQNIEQVLRRRRLRSARLRFEQGQRRISARFRPDFFPERAKRGLIETASHQISVGVIQACAGQQRAAKQRRVRAPSLL